MPKIACLLADGFEETEAIATIDVLRRAGFEVDLVSIHEKTVTSSHRVKLIADKLFENMDDYDAIFLPGGQPGSNNLAADPRVLDLVRTYFHKDKLVAAICAAPTVLAKAGILHGKQVTSYPSSNAGEVFAQSTYKEDLVVKDGNILTSRGVGTVLPFAYAFVEALDSNSAHLQESMLYTMAQKYR